MVLDLTFIYLALKSLPPMISYLLDSVKNVAKLFVDDLKLIADASDKISIENDLSSLEEWESLWLLKFNPKKCKVMHLDYNINPNNEFKLDGVSHDLKWYNNIKLCIKDANRAICWISRNLLETLVIRKVRKRWTTFFPI